MECGWDCSAFAFWPWGAGILLSTLSGLNGNKPPAAKPALIFFGVKSCGQGLIRKVGQTFLTRKYICSPSSPISKYSNPSIRKAMPHERLTYGTVLCDKSLQGAFLLCGLSYKSGNVTDCSMVNGIRLLKKTQNEIDCGVAFNRRQAH